MKVKNKNILMRVLFFLTLRYEVNGNIYKRHIKYAINSFYQNRILDFFFKPRFKPNDKGKFFFDGPYKNKKFFYLLKIDKRYKKYEK